MKKVMLVIALLAASMVAAPTPTATAASNRDSCRGYVHNFYKSSGRVYVHAWVSCSRKQDKVSVKAFLRHGDTWSRPAAITCTHVSVCSAIASLKDPKGTQTYSGGPDAGYYPPSVYARRGSTTVTCHSGMKCTLGGKRY